MGSPSRRHDQPEAIAAKAIHMGIDDGDGRRGSHHRFNGAAALAQDRQRALTGEVVGATAMPWVETLLLCINYPF
ncbi:hypothetical protein LNP24_11105 [Klebsiella pneumoniae subsp. pneumoniae]|nr:hypothetical protein [Klebsiella pneumoniae subsp. pneumoniae]